MPRTEATTTEFVTEDELQITKESIGDHDYNNLTETNFLTSEQDQSQPDEDQQYDVTTDPCK